MSWFSKRTDDPYKDFLRHDAEQYKELERLPKCCCCEEPIQQYDAVMIHGDYYCDDCLDGMRVKTEDGDWREENMKDIMQVKRGMDDGI